jgi:transcriptional regulator with XRE-family HTH domain
MLHKDVPTSSKGFSAIFERVEKSEGYQLDALKVELCEQIYSIMEQEGIAKAELARRLQTSRAYITKLLQGSANFTLESLVKVARALGCNVTVTLRSQAEEEFSSLWKAKSASDSLSESARQRWREFRLTDFVSAGSVAKAYVTTPNEIPLIEKTSARILEFVGKAA